MCRCRLDGWRLSGQQHGLARVECVDCGKRRELEWPPQSGADDEKPSHVPELGFILLAQGGDREFAEDGKVFSEGSLDGERTLRWYAFCFGVLVGAILSTWSWAQTTRLSWGSFHPAHSRAQLTGRDLEQPESRKQVGVASVTHRRSENVPLRGYSTMAVAAPAYPPRTKWHRKLNNFPGSCLWQGRNLGLLWFQT